MLSYQHGYHAGNFADVLKHLTLLRILHYMRAKEKPLLYLDTHAGAGLYDLNNAQALKTAEFKQGIELLWEKKEKAPALCLPYLELIKELNPNGKLRFYPGSPYLAIHSLRASDRLAFSEKHSREFSALEQLNTQGLRVFLSDDDGLSDLRRLVPPIEKRGLIFIDPSYEVKEDYKTLPLLLKAAHTRFATGTYCLWYPIIDRRLHQQWLLRLKNNVGSNALKIEFYLSMAAKTGMYGCGLWIINPPYVLAQEMKTICTFLRTLFNPGISSYLIE